MGINEAIKQIHFPENFESYNNARNKIRTIERDELLEKMVKNYYNFYINTSNRVVCFNNVICIYT